MMRLIKEEWLFFLSLCLCLLTSVVTRRFPRYSVEDFKVLVALFVFLLIIESLKNKGFFSFLASKLQRGRFLPLKLVLFTFFSSMFITNDVALLVVVPLTVSLEFKNVTPIVALEAVAANGGSSVTPFGNPQNLFIYYHFHLNLELFVKSVWMLGFFSLLLLVLILLLFRSSFSVSVKYFEVSFERESVLDLIWFLIFILVVVRILPFYFSVLPLSYYLLIRKVWKVDYFLLGTFLFFFGFTDNLTRLLQFKVEDSLKVFTDAALLSQLVSNVPATLLLANFTTNWKALLWGVNAGGYGTLISSMANLIAYKILAGTKELSFKDFFCFHLVGFLFLFLSFFLFFTLHRIFF